MSQQEYDWDSCWSWESRNTVCNFKKSESVISWFWVRRDSAFASQAFRFWVCAFSKQALLFPLLLEWVLSFFVGWFCLFGCLFFWQRGRSLGFFLLVGFCVCISLNIRHEKLLKAVKIRPYKGLAGSVVNPCFKKHEVSFLPVCPFNTMDQVYVSKSQRGEIHPRIE